MKLESTQIIPHQVAYEAVAPLSIALIHSAEDMSFPTIVAEYNGPLASVNRHINGIANKYNI